MFALLRVQLCPTNGQHWFCLLTVAFHFYLHLDTMDGQRSCLLTVALDFCLQFDARNGPKLCWPSVALNFYFLFNSGNGQHGSLRVAFDLCSCKNQHFVGLRLLHFVWFLWLSTSARSWIPDMQIVPDYCDFQFLLTLAFQKGTPIFWHHMAHVLFACCGFHVQYLAFKRKLINHTRFY